MIGMIHLRYTYIYIYKASLVAQRLKHIYIHTHTHTHTHTHLYMTSLVTQMVERLPAIWEIQIPSLGWEDPLEKETATH